MKFNLIIRTFLFPLIIFIAATPASADQPYGKRDDHERHMERHDDERHESRRDYLDDSNRRFIHEYYGEKFRHGRCPHGLAKKGNGCYPPGQVKHWKRGEMLPQHVRRYPVPNELLIRLPPPPRGHRYVRVASDILLIAIGTALIVDAIEDIGQ